MSNFVEDVCALVSVEINRRDGLDGAFTDKQLYEFLESCEDKDHMLIMLAGYVSSDFTVESWQERMQDFWPAWDQLLAEEETE